MKAEVGTLTGYMSHQELGRVGQLGSGVLSRPLGSPHDIAACVGDIPSTVF